MDKFVFLCLVFAAIVAFISSTLNMFALYVVIPVTFLIMLIRRDTLSNNRMLRILALMFFWLFLSSLQAVNTGKAFGELSQILGTFLLCYVICSIKANTFNPSNLYFLIIIFAVGMYVYVALFMDISLLYSQSLSEGERFRLGDEKMNTNMLAYYSFYLTFAIFMLGNGNKLSALFRLLFWGCIPLSLILAVYTASRQILIIQLPLIAVLIFVRYHRSKHKRWLFMLIVLFVLFIYNSFTSLYEGSFLQSRYEVNVKDDIRFMLMREAIAVGCAHPIFGVGPGNFVLYNNDGLFSHCTYTELLANGGFPALFLYFLLLISSFRLQIKRYKQSGNVEYVHIAIFIFFFAVCNVFYVYYKSMWLMAFYFVFLHYSDLINSRLVSNYEDCKNICRRSMQ